MSIKEIAERAGVSISTVSRVVNGGNNSAASPETRQRIWDAVRELGYVPNESAQNLKNAGKLINSKSKDIDCFYARASGKYIDNFFMTLMQVAEEEAFSRGYNLRYQYSFSDFNSANTLEKPENASVMVLGRLEPDALAALKSRYKNIVYVGLQTNNYDIDQVISNGYAATGDCVRYLYSLGHRRILYLGETRNEQRFQGYRDALSELGLPFDNKLVLEASFTPGSGYRALSAFMDEPVDFTAVLCANDMLAVGVLKAAKEHRKKIPEDISVIGINDMETMRYLSPMLTTIHIHIEEMGKMAAKLLIDRINGGHKLPMKVELPYKLIERDSCTKAKE